MEALSRVPHRYAGSPGEREILQQVKDRLPTGVVGRVEGFVAFTSPGLVVGLHAAAILLAGLLGLVEPLSATLLGGLATLSLWAEGTGKFSILRLILPKQASYNLVARLEAGPAGGSSQAIVPDGGLAPIGTVILTAPLDIPRWRPDPPRWFRRPLQAVLLAAAVVVALLALRVLAQPWGRPSQGLYAASLLVLGTSVALGFVAHRRTGGAAEDASGPAVLLEVARRMQAAPMPGVDLWFVWTGCGHAYQNGMHAFLAMRGQRLKSPVLVIALDEPGRPPLGAVVSEGPLFAERHRPTGPALVERLRWAGLQIPSIDHAGVTDARAALRWGYRAVALSGGSATSSPDLAEKAADVTEALVRLFGYDVARTADFTQKMGELAVDRVPPPEVVEQRAIGRLLGRLRARVARKPEDDPELTPLPTDIASLEPMEKRDKPAGDT